MRLYGVFFGRVLFRTYETVKSVQFLLFRGWLLAGQRATPVEDEWSLGAQGTNGQTFQEFLGRTFCAVLRQLLKQIALERRRNA